MARPQVAERMIFRALDLPGFCSPFSSPSRPVVLLA